MQKTVAARLASLIEARKNCEQSANHEWHARHSGEIMRIARDHLPSGSGIDSGCVVMSEESRSDRLVIHVPFHCMNEHGFYDGWRDYRVIVRPAFHGLSLTVAGRDYNGIKDYLADVFMEALGRIIPESDV